MSGKFVIEVEGKYLGPDGEGGFMLFDSISEELTLDSYEEAKETAIGYSKDGWRIITCRSPS